MDSYTLFDYLGNEPFYVQGIGHLQCPTLRDIRIITYQKFLILLNMILVPLTEYLKLSNLEEHYNELSIEDQQQTSIYYILLYGNRELLNSMLNCFLKEKWEFNPTTLSFTIFSSEQDSKEPIGHLGNDNFEVFRTSLQLILGIEKTEENTPIFKNKAAENIYYKMQKHSQSKSKIPDENYTLDNMIKKYCTHNKVGINILNVWDMTYYQFTKMFTEYCNGRQCDFNDMMAANSFNFKKSSDYKPFEYIQKLE